MSFLLRTKILSSKTRRKFFIVPTNCEKSNVLLVDYTAITETFLSQSLAKEMSWHASPRADVRRMVHPSDGESWKHFDRCHPNFASEARNVRLVLCTDGFNPWGMSTKQYSIWPVMVTSYNLPPWLCMKTRFIWLTVLIPGSSNPKKRLDIYLRPLIDDLVHLWNIGVDTYDLISLHMQCYRGGQLKENSAAPTVLTTRRHSC
ncbi:hypothetical protein QQ045_012881 [Rhodiola kirilowii]